MTELCAHSFGSPTRRAGLLPPPSPWGALCSFHELNEREKHWTCRMWFRRLDGRNLVAIGKLFKLRICSVIKELKYLF